MLLNRARTFPIQLKGLIYLYITNLNGEHLSKSIFNSRKSHQQFRKFVKYLFTSVELVGILVLTFKIRLFKWKTRITLVYR